MSEVTVAQLDELVSQLVKKEAEKDAASLVVTNINKEIATIEGRCVAYLKELGRSEYSTPLGKLKIDEKWRVNMPADDMAKKDLFNHLRERGIFDKYATVNSNSLNALFMADWKEAKKKGEGMTFAMPGIEPPKLHEALNFKLNKKKE